MSELRQDERTNAYREQSISAIKILEYQVRFLNNQIKLRHREFDLASIQVLWANKREAIRHLSNLKNYLIKS